MTRRLSALSMSASPRSTAHAATDHTGGHVAGADLAISVFIGLGANLGDRRGTLHTALAAMGQLPATQLLRVSPLYRSAPVEAGGPDYLNAVVELATMRTAQELLEALQTIEQSAGRERPYRNAPRTLDLDILWFGGQVIATQNLVVPHPRMAERAFVLRPLWDLAPERVNAEWLQAVASQDIQLLEGAQWAADLL